MKPNQTNNTERILQTALKMSLKKATIRIPSKLESAVQYIDDQTLELIHSDRSVAREVILYFCSFINSFNNEHELGKPLYSKCLAKLLSPIAYKRVVDACLQGTPQKGPIVQRANYQAGSHSYLYSFTSCYSKCPRVKYTFKTAILKRIYLRNNLKRIELLKDNPIIKNLLAVYPHVGMPSKMTLKACGIAKSKDPNYRTKTGKKLIYRNGNPRSRYESRPDFESLSFLDDHLTIFDYITNPHWLIPSLQINGGGNRVTDTFTLMPSWMREYLTIHGESIAECDFKAFHPNIIMSLYGGKKTFLTHSAVADKIGGVSDLPKFKKSHLAFFNCPENIMVNAHGDLWDYYRREEPTMMDNLLSDKDNSDHKITSKKLFEKEVEIMSAVIQKLNDQGIFVLYVYDALLCQERHVETVVKTMNETTIEHGVFTCAEFKNLASESLLRVKTAEDAPNSPNRPENAKYRSAFNDLPAQPSFLAAA